MPGWETLPIGRSPTESKRPRPGAGVGGPGAVRRAGGRGGGAGRPVLEGRDLPRAAIGRMGPASGRRLGPGWGCRRCARTTVSRTSRPPSPMDRSGLPAGLRCPAIRIGIRRWRSRWARVGQAVVFGAKGPRAFDCSGLTQAAWAAAGVGISPGPCPRSTTATRSPPGRRGAGGPAVQRRFAGHRQPATPRRGLRRRRARRRGPQRHDRGDPGAARHLAEQDRRDPPDRRPRPAAGRRRGFPGPLPRPPRRARAGGPPGEMRDPDGPEAVSPVADRDLLAVAALVRPGRGGDGVSASSWWSPPGSPRRCSAPRCS